MAWDSPRRGADPLARAWGRQFIGVDELDFYKSVNLSTTRDQDETRMGKLLSPIDEEGHGMSYSHHKNAPLAVHLTVRFNDLAVKSVHSNSYYSSRSFRASDRICRGLVRRIDHGSEELITRKDPHALNNIQCLRKGPKPWRFELTFKINVKGHSGPWAERIYISYQKQPLNRTSAEQVLHSTHSIVGLFLQRHDRGFYWKDGPSESYFPDSPETFRPGPDVVPNLACVPRTLFVESTQDWEFVPGYTLRLVVKSNNPARAQSNITRTVRVDSAQISPLNLGLGEDLLSQAYRCVQDVLDAKKNTFDELHTDCDDGFGGHCRHHGKGALSLELDVVNNLGPAYDHLHRSIQSDFGLFGDAEGQDCNEFADTVRNQFKMLRGKMDQKIEKFHDFDFRIAELIGDGWHETDCAGFAVNGHHTLTRRNIEALLERIRTGVGDVLREYDVVVRLVAYKRGHLVLDKALVARDRHPGPSDPPLVLINRLKERIQKDIDMICQDTCSLDDIPEAAPLFTPSRRLTGRSPQTPPGSPASFRTRPPTPPGVPARISSARSFPLVPIKYKDSADGASVSSRSPRPPVVGDEGFPGLKPAAEVYPSSRTVDFDVESDSTHSSMPTLAESDTPSPEHSMLITPSGAQSFLPIPGGLPFEDSGFRRFSTDGASASSRTSYSEGHQWVEYKDEKKPSVPANTPRTCDNVEMQDREDSSGSNHVSGTNTLVCPPPSTDEVVRPGPEYESCGHDLPTESWLLHCSEPDAQGSETPKGSHSSTTAAPEGGATVAKVEEEASIGEAAVLKHDSDAALVSHSGPAETSEKIGQTASDTRDTTGDEARSRSMNSETIETCTPTGHSVGSKSGQYPMGVSERSEYKDHVTAGFDETQLNVASGLTDGHGESTSGSPNVTDLDENLYYGPDEKPASDPSISPTVVVKASETEQEDHVDSQSLVSPVPTRESMTSAPTVPSSEAISCRLTEETELPDTATSAPTEPRHSKHLLPEPNPPNRNSWSSSSEWEDWISEARHSCDSVDTIRASLHSSIQEDADIANHRPDSPKRLRTPTAGLLGLSESRWADFGIRNALTGTYAFDTCRPSTAPLLVESPGPVKTRREEFELRDEGTQPAKPHKTGGHPHHHQHMRHKKSIGSILFMGGAKLNKRQSGELKKPKANKKPTATVEPPLAKEPVEDVGRFPRAMMLVAGLAFASSVVSRNSS